MPNINDLPSGAGLVIKSFGRQYHIYFQDKVYQAVSRGKSTEFVVGDLVKLKIVNEQQAQILELITRQNLIYRVDRMRRKLIASNIDQLFIVVAAKPQLQQTFLDSCLVFAEANNITPVIVVNKIDLDESALLITTLESLYAKKLGYQLVKINAQASCSKLHAMMLGKANLLIGNSGVGKSTITNQIIPKANSRTGEINKDETRGCHTTTNSSLYFIDNNTYLVDCPGLSNFGLYDLKEANIATYFPEMIAYIGECRFNNCHHLSEPDCAIVNAHTSGKIDTNRFRYFQLLVKSLTSKANLKF